MSLLSDDERLAILLRIRRLKQTLRHLNEQERRKAWNESYELYRVRQAINSTTLTRTPVPDSVEAWLDSEEGEEWLRK